MFGIRFLILTLCAAKDIKGVAPSDQHLYAPDADGLFSCSSDPSIKIPFDRVNDDYCDCPDGSDEPGTAACPNGRFWCVGSQQYIPSRIVGDGACDYEVCCDGSDEAVGLCPDRCAEVKAAQAAKREAERQFSMDGDAMRQDLIRQAQERKIELETQVADLNTQVTSIQSKSQAAEAESQLAQKEDEENLADPESVRAIGELRDTLRLTEADVSEISERFTKLKDAYGVLDRALDRMSSDYNPNFNDPAVKEAIKIWKDHSAPNMGLPVLHRNLISDMDLLDKIKIANQQSMLSKPQLSLVDKLLPPVITDFLVDWGIRDPKSGDRGLGVRSQRVKLQLGESQQALSDARSFLSTNEKLLSLGEEFWGQGEVGRSLENVCITTKHGDFSYEACLFGRAVQINGYNHVQLGESTGLKESPNGQLTIEFMNGDRCPNGLSRSLTVFLECGHHNEATFVEEPEVCHYVMKAKSPIACKLSSSGQTEIVHGEL